MVECFLQELRDWGDIWSDIEPIDRVRVPHEYTSRIADLEAAGLWVFVGKRKHPYSTMVAGKAAAAHLDVAVVTIRKSNNPGIIRPAGGRDGARLSA